LVSQPPVGFGGANIFSQSVFFSGNLLSIEPSHQRRIGFIEENLKNNGDAMNNNKLPFVRTARTILLGSLLVFGTATVVHAQGELASGTIGNTGSGPYTYNLSFSDAAGATSPIGSIWYSWVPGQFFLPGVPTSAFAPVGWTAAISGNSVQFIANSAGNDILAGQTLSGFGYQANFTPAQLAAAPNGGVSVAYSGGLFSDAGQTFTVQPVPEPSAPMFLLSGATAFWLMRRRSLRAA
jgi:hypothetical protein